MARKTGKAASKSRRAAQKAKQRSSSSKSSSSSSKKTTRYETTDGRKFTDKADATAHQRKLNDAGKGRGTGSDVNLRGETREPVNEPTKPNAAATETKGLSLDELLKDALFKGLPKDQQEVVKAVYLAIGENNAQSAQRLVGAFNAATKLADPFFKQQIALARDAVERGFVEIDKELEFEKMQAERRLQDLQRDVELQSEFLTIEEQNDLKAIERDYKQTLDTTRQNLAASGMSSSSIRNDKEQIIEEVTGELREGTRRKFGYEKQKLQNELGRRQRDNQAEIQRLSEVAKQNKTGLFRRAEEQLGTAGLPALNFNMKPLGGITGSIETDRTNDIITGVKNLIF